MLVMSVIRKVFTRGVLLVAITGALLIVLAGPAIAGR
jgi:hypothetical protein